MPISDGNFTYYNKDGKWERIQSPENLAKNIIDTINYYKERTERYRNEAEKTRSEVMEEIKDEVSELKAKLARTPFKFTKVENERYSNFIRTHYKKGCDCHKGFSISFVGTGVGTCYDMICNDCGEKEEITDYDAW